MLRHDYIEIIEELKISHPEDYNLQIAMYDKIIGEILEEAISSSSEAPLELLKTHYLNRGDTYFKNGDHQLAIEDFTKVINNPNQGYIQAYLERGSLHENQGCLDLAEADYRSVLELVEEQSRQKVEQSLQRVISLKQASELELSALQKEEDYELVVKGFTKIIDHYEMTYAIKSYIKQAYIKRALAYEHQGCLDLAEIDYNKALQFEENLTQQNDIEKALQRVKKLKFEQEQQTLDVDNQESIREQIVKDKAC